MGEVEVVVSSEDEMEVVLHEEEEERGKKKESSTSVIRWESFLPRMFIRVLLVESDDSTRQIIAALLRKCSYKVAAVPDGLKAWETLKERPQSIDLVLTEVELPSISGFSLLTMIMEHDICKHIPVIMMSSHDSVGTVFKCMLRGAADFLVKPVRKNELRNLWQHVWRRHSSSGGGLGHQDGIPAQQKGEAISVNNAASNHSSDYVASVQKNKECTEKGSDAQSSCTKPDMEAESAFVQNMQDLLQPECRSPSFMSNTKTQKHKECVKLDENLSMHESEAEDKSSRLGSEVAPCNNANESMGINVEKGHASARTMTQSEDVEQESRRKDTNISRETDNNNDQVKPSRVAIDLIGAFDRCLYAYNTVGQEVLFNYAKTHCDSNDATNKLSSSPLLELSLKRSHPSDCDIQRTDEKNMLNHSNASPFSRYNNRTMQPLIPTSAIFHTEQNNSYKHLSNQGPVNAADAPQWNGAPLNNNQESMTSVVVGQPGQAESAFPCPQLGAIPVPVPVRGIRFDTVCSGYGGVLPPVFYAQSGPQPMWSQNSASQQESAIQVNSSHQSNPEPHNFEQGCSLHDQNANHSTSQTVHKLLEQNTESVEDPLRVSPATGQSATSSLCNGAASHLNSSGCGSVCNGSNGNVTPAAVTRTTSESGNDEGLFVHDGIIGMDSHRYTQREAALNKFRLKRKDRCYEKKVRYQSRKRLAEQRPRVKGQFVRQVPAYPPTETDQYYGSLVA